MDLAEMYLTSALSTISCTSGTEWLLPVDWIVDLTLYTTLRKLLFLWIWATIWKSVEPEIVRSQTFSLKFILLSEKIPIIEPFNQANCFALPEGRMRFRNALLHPCSYTKACPHCGEEHRDICNHLITTCPLTFNPRKKLNLKLTLYNYPEENFLLTKKAF